MRRWRVGRRVAAAPHASFTRACHTLRVSLGVARGGCTRHTPSLLLQVSAHIERLGLSNIAPEATARLAGEQWLHVSGKTAAVIGEGVTSLTRDILSSGAYAVQYQAVPYHRAAQSQSEQERALLDHPEKKALVDLLQRTEYDELGGDDGPQRGGGEWAGLLTVGDLSARGHAHICLCPMQASRETTLTSASAPGRSPRASRSLHQFQDVRRLPRMVQSRLRAAAPQAAAARTRDGPRV